MKLAVSPSSAKPARTDQVPAPPITADPGVSHGNLLRIPVEGERIYGHQIHDAAGAPILQAIHSAKQERRRRKLEIAQRIHEARAQFPRLPVQPKKPAKNASQQERAAYATKLTAWQDEVEKFKPYLAHAARFDAMF